MKDQTTFHTLWPAANGTRTTPSLSAMVARKKIKFFLFSRQQRERGATTRSASRPSRVITAVHILLLLLLQRDIFFLFSQCITTKTSSHFTSDLVHVRDFGLPFPFDSPSEYFLAPLRR